MNDANSLIFISYHQRPHITLPCEYLGVFFNKSLNGLRAKSIFFVSRVVKKLLKKTKSVMWDRYWNTKLCFGSHWNTQHILGQVMKITKIGEMYT